MKNIKKYTLALMCVFVFTTIGCSEDFLEKRPSEDTLTTQQVDEIKAKDPKITEALVTGLYLYMSQAGVGGVGSHEDFGQKGNDIISDILSCDMAYRNAYGRYRNIANLTSLGNFAASNPHYMFWRYYYKIIAQANNIIKLYGGNDAVPSKDTEKHLYAQAKTMRAYAYFYLATYYTKEYNPSEKVLILYDQPETKAKAQTTTEEVIKLVESDLQQAITLLDGFNRGTNKSIVNKYVAEGLLAYVYAYKGEYPKVIPLCNDIISSGEYPITPKENIYNGMNNVNEEDSWMWGLDIIKDMKMDLLSFWGQMDVYSYSYPAFGGLKRMDDQLVAQFNAKDLRKKQFSDSSFGYGPNLPYKKFFAPERVFRGAKKIIEVDVVYMRVEEFYLLKAEAEAKLDQDVNAVATLTPLLEQRYESSGDYSYVTSKTGNDLDDEIYLQTRLELWGEGKSYLAMKRNKATVSRGSNHSLLPNTSYQYNDPKLTLLVPKDEVENNPNVQQ